MFTSNAGGSKVDASNVGVVETFVSWEPHDGSVSYRDSP